MAINCGARAHDITTATDFETLGTGLEAQGASCTQLALGKAFPTMPSGATAINPGMGEYCRAALARHGVSVAVLGCYGNLFDPDTAKFKAYLRHARYFGAPVVGTHPGRVADGMDPEEGYLRFRGIVRRLTAIGERFGAIVGLEPCHRHAIFDLDSTERLLRDIDSPYLGVILDPTCLLDIPTDLANDIADGGLQGSGRNNAQAAIAQAELSLIDEAFARFGGSIVAFHAKDFTIELPSLDSSDTAAAVAIENKSQEPQLKAQQIGDGIAPIAEQVEIVQRYRPYLPIITEETKDDRIGKTLRMLQAH